MLPPTRTYFFFFNDTATTEIYTLSLHDALPIQPNGARIKFDRTNLVPFSLDIGSSETLHANGLGGDDAITVGEVGGFSVTASGGSGNDTLIGGGSSGTFLGGS